MRRWRGAGGLPGAASHFRPVPGSFLALTYLYCGATVPFLRSFPGRRDHGETRRMSGRVLVTGGAGFIGSHIAEAYLTEGWEVVVLDDLSRGHEQNVPKAARFVRADIRSPEARQLLATGKFDALNHHAAQIDVRVSVDQPAFDAGINVVGFVNLLEGAGEGGVKRVVFASSGGVVYGDPDGDPHARDRAQAAGLALRREQARRRVLPPGARRAARVRGRGDALRQRLRAAAGSEVRGRRGLDLRLPPAGRREAHRLRRRPADARLRLRAGRRPRQRARHHA